MNRRLVEQALVLYGINWIKINEAQSGYRNQSYRIEANNGQILNLIIFKPESGILERVKRADQVSEQAAESGLPTRRRRDQRTLCLAGPARNYYARLYQYLPGDTIPWEAYGQKHIKLLGLAMSDLHHAVADLKLALPSASAEGLSYLNEMKTYFQTQGVSHALKNKLHLAVNPGSFPSIAECLGQLGRQPDQIPLHLDLVRGNILYGDSDSPWRINGLSLTGLIDFEKTARGPAIFDLARTYAFLLTDCAHKTPAKLYKYLISSGYNKRGRNRVDLTGPAAHNFHKLVRFYLLYDFYKFLRHNPYESLPANHHFVRVRDILLTRKMLKLV